jgi:hypothetical protein
MLYAYIRAGKLDDAVNLCRKAHQPWRAASIRGSLLFQWREIGVSSFSGYFFRELKNSQQTNRTTTPWTRIMILGGVIDVGGCGKQHAPELHSMSDISHSASLMILTPLSPSLPFPTPSEFCMLHSHPLLKRPSCSNLLVGHGKTISGRR